MTFTIKSNKPAQAPQSVVFCCDENYLTYALWAAERIVKTHPNRAFDICLCHTGPLHIPDTLSRHELRTVQIDPHGAFDDLEFDQRRSAAMYLRLAVPEALSSDYSRILYLDSDIFVQGGDIETLLGVDLRGHPVGAVRDNIQWRTPLRMPLEFKALGMPNAPYFNSGVMLIDVKSWQEQRITAKAIEFGKAHVGQLERHDQTVLNAILHRNWAEISPAWNWQYSERARLLEPMFDAHIIHFIGPRKPWSDKGHQLPPRFANDLGDFLRRNMPDFHTEGRYEAEASDSPALNSRLMRKMLLRHYLGLRKMQNYLSRFPTSFTVQGTGHATP